MRLLLISLFILAAVINGPAQTRRNYRLPDIPGYITLKGDFHMHTPFSDGSVWPEDRVKEAWRDGLDVIAITDHLEYHAWDKDVSTDMNRPYEIARPVADQYGIILIRAAEITRSMPPGHFNALFTSDNNAINKKDIRQAFTAAKEQGAFFIWNHPGWKAQQADTTLWFPMHTEFYNNGWLQGIEIFNEKEYYPLVQQWANERKLTIFANSDVHSPIDFLYDPIQGETRPMTLVFAKEKSLHAVREALFAGRTAAIFNDTLAGSEEFLLPLVEQCLKLEHGNLFINDKKEVSFVLTNTSDFPFILSGIPVERFTLPERVMIGANSSAVISLKNRKEPEAGENKYILSFRLLNVLPAPDVPLEINFDINAFYWKKPVIKSTGENTWTIDMGNNSDYIRYYYTINGDEPGLSSGQVSESFTAIDSVDLRIAAFRQKDYVGTYQGKFLLHKALNTNVSLSHEPVKKYACQGAKTLTDGLSGSSEFNDGRWLGFQNTDPEVVIELDKPTSIRIVKTHFLETSGSWIFLPRTVTLLVSLDGSAYKELGKVSFRELTSDSDRGIVGCVFRKPVTNVKFIKLVIKSLGLCPSWHSGAGKPAWFFMDEVVVK